VTRNTNTCKSEGIVDERSATGASGDGTSVEPDETSGDDDRTVSDELLATLAEVED